MALPRFFQSCDQANDYPNNLIDPGPTFPSVLREYAQRLNGRVDSDMPLFCPEVYSKVETFRYREDNGRRVFGSEVSNSLRQLKQRLPGSAGQIQTDSPCTFIFVGAESARHALYISRDMALWLLTFFQVLPPFLEFLFAFGQKIHDLDFHFSGFREDTRIESSLRRDEIPELGRKGQDFQLCYNLKTFEKKPGLQWPWSSRQAVIFHSFDVENGHASWIVIKANNVIRDRLKELSNTRLAKDQQLFDDISKMFAHALAGHLIAVEWSGENWRSYLNDIEEQIIPLRRRAIVDKVARYVSEENARDPSIPLVDGSPRPTTLRALTFGSRRTTTRSQVAAPPQPVAALPVGVAVNVPEPPQEPPNVPPEYDPKIQGETSEEERNMRYQIQELQDAQALESKVNDASLVLKSNIQVLTQIEDYFHELPHCADLPARLKLSMPPQIARFLKRVRSVRSDLEMHLERIRTMSTLISEFKELLYGIVEYQAMQANYRFADEAKRSAERMERMTHQMREMAIKTTLETVLMRIITVVTVFFLPATFVSTLMSTDIVQYSPSDSNISSGASSAGALKLFLCLTFSFMAATAVAGFGLLWGALGASITS